jgi:hypothetical protein
MYSKDKKKKMMYGGMAKKKMMYGGMAKKKMMSGGRVNYMSGGEVKMDGCQPVYSGTPKAKAN